jgi:hypothetical protein
MWGVIRNILKGRDLKNDVKPCDWVKYFDGTFSRKINGGVLYETQLFGPYCI